MAGNPKWRPSNAAAKVPEYNVSSPMLQPALMPDTTRSTCPDKKPFNAKCTQSAGVPFTQ